MSLSVLALLCWTGTAGCAATVHVGDECVALLERTQQVGSLFFVGGLFGMQRLDF